MIYDSLSSAELQFTIQNFLFHEAHLLDTRQFEAWRDLFTDQGRYWVPLKPGQKRADAEASLFDDDKTMMATRIERLRHPNIHSQIPPHRTCRVVGNVTIHDERTEDGAIIVSSLLLMTDYRLRTTRLFSAHVTHNLLEQENQLRINMKTVALINCDDAFELIAVPF